MLFARWVHIVSAVTWVGGSAFIALVLVPLQSAAILSSEANRAIGLRYRQIIYAVIAVLVISGIILTIERIYESPSTVWIVVFAFKLALSVWMMYIIWRKRYLPGQGDFTNRYLRVLSKAFGYNALLVLGVVVLLLASLMQRVFEVNRGL